MIDHEDRCPTCQQFVLIDEPYILVQNRSMKCRVFVHRACYTRYCLEIMKTVLDRAPLTFSDTGQVDLEALYAIAKEAAWAMCERSSAVEAASALN
jgi:hypothetical protein